jgi:hypothetical protein
MLRILEGAVIDFPAPVLHPRAYLWVATCWPDSRQPGGWGRALWWASPYHPGYVPVALAPGDVIEFGADIPIRRWCRIRWVPVRRYGSALFLSRDELLVYGPYSNPVGAASVTGQLLDALARGYPHSWSIWS